MPHDKMRLSKDLVLDEGTQCLYIWYSNLLRGGVVKLVITSACHAEGRGFESPLSRHFQTYIDIWPYTSFSKLLSTFW